MRGLFKLSVGRGHEPLRVRTGEEEPSHHGLMTTAVRVPMGLFFENSQK